MARSLVLLLEEVLSSTVPTGPLTLGEFFSDDESATFGTTFD